MSRYMSANTSAPENANKTCICPTITQCSVMSPSESEPKVQSSQCHSIKKRTSIHSQFLCLHHHKWGNCIVQCSNSGSEQWRGVNQAQRTACRTRASRQGRDGQKKSPASVQTQIQNTLKHQKNSIMQYLQIIVVNAQQNYWWTT